MPMALDGRRRGASYGRARAWCAVRASVVRQGAEPLRWYLLLMLRLRCCTQTALAAASLHLHSGGAVCAAVPDSGRWAQPHARHTKCMASEASSRRAPSRRTPAAAASAASAAAAERGAEPDRRDGCAAQHRDASPSKANAERRRSIACLSISRSDGQVQRQPSGRARGPPQRRCVRPEGARHAATPPAPPLPPLLPRQAAQPRAAVESAARHMTLRARYAALRRRGRPAAPPRAPHMLLLSAIRDQRQHAHLTCTALAQHRRDCRTQMQHAAQTAGCRPLSASLRAHGSSSAQHSGEQQRQTEEAHGELHAAAHSAAASVLPAVAGGASLPWR